MGSHALPGRPTPLITILAGCPCLARNHRTKFSSLFALITFSIGRSTVQAARFSRGGRVLTLTVFLGSTVLLDLCLLSAGILLVRAFDGAPL